MKFKIFTFLYLTCVAVIDGLTAYNETQGLTSLYLSMATFCNVSTYKTRKFIGPTEGFVVTKVIDSALGTVGFVGYLPSDASIYVAFRGSSSVRNWISDFDVVKTSYTSFPECDCEVAQGFYRAEQSVIGIVVDEIRALQVRYPTYAVKVTGHSYGAAVAQLISMDLSKNGIASSLYNFGQPRTGDQNYANFVSMGIASGVFPTTWRVVHNRDIVPHWPFKEYLNYHHVCSEEFEDEYSILKSCGSMDPNSMMCEDASCSDQFNQPRDWRPDDHMWYLGLYISCETVSE